MIEKDFPTLASECRTSCVLVCYAEFSFSWKDTRRTSFDPGRVGHEAWLTSLMVGKWNFWQAQGLGFVLPTNKQQPMIDKSGQVLRVEEQEAVAV